MLGSKNIVAALLLAISSSAWAFMPATGIWGIDSENNGSPGRGFQIEAENGIIVFTYFGYRADGSSVFHYAGPIVNNTFTASLLDLRGGTSFGGPYQMALLSDPAGTVTINFTSGKHGFITLPSEPQRAISKMPFGYADGPDGLLGTWLFTEIVGTQPFSDVHRLVINTGKKTSDGNGVVMTALADFTCEFQTSGSYAEMVVCAGLPLIGGKNIFVLKFSGNRGDGLASFVELTSVGLTNYQDAHALRIETKNGVKTGLNDGTQASLTNHSQLAPPQLSTQTREQGLSEKSLSTEDLEKTAALNMWAL